MPWLAGAERLGLVVTRSRSRRASRGDPETRQQLRQPLPRQPELGSGLTAVATVPDERRPHESLVERPARLLETPRVGRSVIGELGRERGRRHDTALRRPYRERGEHVLEL